MVLDLRFIKNIKIKRGERKEIATNITYLCDLSQNLNVTCFSHFGQVVYWLEFTH